MFPAPPWPIVVILIMFVLALVGLVMAAYGVFLNWLLKAPLFRHVISTAIVGIVVYFVSSAVLLEVTPPLRWVNEVPQDTRTWVWDHIQILSGGVTFVCASLWQVIVRSVRAFSRPGAV